MEEKPHWAGKSFSFFSHKDCEYYPCHSVPAGTAFNCLFCYCPLYALGQRCGGNFTYLKNGVKNCSECLLPHRPESYGIITEKFGEIIASMPQEKQDLDE